MTGAETVSDIGYRFSDAVFQSRDAMGGLVCGGLNRGRGPNAGACCPAMGKIGGETDADRPG
jgi:hypothetical protein